MYFCVIEASPNPTFPTLRKYGGANAACWIKTDDRNEGRAAAKRMLQSSGWDFVRRLEEKEVTPAFYDEDAEGLGFCRQAEIDGEVCVVYTFPVGEKPDMERKGLANSQRRKRVDRKKRTVR